MRQLFSRTYDGASDLDRLIDFATNVAKARWPRQSYKKVGDIVWGAPGTALNSNIRLWFDGSALVAYGWFDPPITLEFDIYPGIGAYELVGDAVLEWGEDRRRVLAPTRDEKLPKAYAMLGYRSECLTPVLESDEERIALVERHGFAGSDGFEVLYSRSLRDPIPAPSLAPPLILRHATEADLEARVDLHRDAWSVWGPSGITVENYRRLRSGPVYDPELDVVLDDGNGRLLAYCIGWLDRTNGFGQFEPVGCRPACTGRGYARAVTIEAMRRMRARGMHTALVSTASVNARARILYPSCGFSEVDRCHHYVRSVSLGVR